MIGLELLRRARGELCDLTKRLESYHDLRAGGRNLRIHALHSPRTVELRKRKDASSMHAFMVMLSSTQELAHRRREMKDAGRRS